MFIKSKRGFTLIELLIVVVIIAILATVLISRFKGVERKVQEAKRKAEEVKRTSKPFFKVRIMGENVLLHNIANGYYVVWLEYQYPTRIPDYVVKFQKHSESIQLMDVRQVIFPTRVDSADLGITTLSGTLVIPVFSADLKITVWYTNVASRAFIANIEPFITPNGYWVAAGGGGINSNVLDAIWVLYFEKSLFSPTPEAESFEGPK